METKTLNFNQLAQIEGGTYADPTPDINASHYALVIDEYQLACISAASLSLLMTIISGGAFFLLGLFASAGICLDALTERRKLKSE